MQRVILFLFLVLGIPSLIYWASHGFESPALNIRRFVSEAAALTGPPAPQTEPEKRVTRKKKARPDPQDKPDAGDQAEEPERKPDKTAFERGLEHYEAGRFDEAAKELAAVDKRQHSLATLGLALQQAFPVAVPPGTYYVVTSTGGTEFEGFGEERDGMLRLTFASGRSLSLPNNAIQSRMTLPTEKALDRIARRIATDSASAAVSGLRLFVLVQEGLTIGRPATVAPLLATLLEKDARKEFIMSAVLNRVPRARQDEVYRALGRCQAIQDEPHPQEPFSRTPTRIGNGEAQKPKSKPMRRGSSIKSKRAREFVRKAAPHKKEGKRLYTKVFVAGRDKAKLADVDKGVAELEKALAYYDQAREIEEAGEILALQSYCSKLAFKLRFWREQLGGK